MQAEDQPRENSEQGHSTEGVRPRPARPSRSPSIDLRQAAKAAAEQTAAEQTAAEQTAAEQTAAEQTEQEASGTERAPSPELPWMQWDIGDRVVVRFREKDYRRDALGILLEATPHHVVIDTKRGPVKVLASTMVVGRKVLPPKRRFKPLPPMPSLNTPSREPDSPESQV